MACYKPLSCQKAQAPLGISQQLKLLFITLTGMSDAVLATGVLDRALRGFPGIQVTVACPGDIAPLFEAVPNLDRTVLMNEGTMAGPVAMWLQCFYVPWTVVIDLRNTPLSGLMLGRRVRKLARTNPDIHMLMQFAQGLGMKRLPEPTIWTAERHVDEAARLVRGTGPVLALAPSAARPSQEWPQEHYIGLVDKLTGKSGPLANAKIVLVGGKADRRRMRSLIEVVPKRRRVDLFEATHPLVLAEVFRRATLCVGNDNAAMHIAAAAGCPTIALYGPTRDDITGPWGDHTRIVRTPETVAQIEALPGYSRAARESYMTSLTVTAVAKAASALLKRKPGRAA